MRKIRLMVFLGVVLISSRIQAQSSNIEINFDNGQATFTAINSDAAQPSYALSVAGGILKLDVAKRAQDWSFLGMFSQNINITANPNVQFRVKASADVTFTVRIKARPISNPAADMLTVEKSVSLTGGNDFSEYFFDITAELDAMPEFNRAKIEEIHIDCSAGWDKPYSGTVEVDYVKIGFAKAVESKGTGYTENFSGAEVPAGVIQNVNYSFAAGNGSLEVGVNRNTRWMGFNYEMDGSYDISANPYLNLSIKTDNDMVLQVFLIDANGNGYQVASTGTQYVYDELVSGKFEYRQARIYKGNDFINVLFDFTGAKNTIVDLSKIAKIKFVSNGTALGYSGKYFISEIKLGDHAVRSAYIGQIPDRNYLVNAAGSKEIILPEIRDALEITCSGAESLISGVSVTPVTYTNAVEDGRSVKYGYASLSFSLVPDASGTDTITLTAKGNEGFTDNTMKFVVTLNENHAPEIEKPADIVVKTGTDTEVKLTGITSSDPYAEQELVLSATSDNYSVINVINTDYSSPDHYGKISFKALAAGVANISLNVSDGQDTTTVIFKVTAYTELNNVPAIDPVSALNVNNAAGLQTISLTGISDGDVSVQNLTFTATSSNASVIPDPVISYTQGLSTATMAFTPTGATGKINFTVTLTDDGGNAQNDGNKSVSVVIPVEVTVFNPTGFEFNMAAPGALDSFAPENLGSVYYVAIVDTLGGKAMRVTMKEKWTYGGIWMSLPYELDLNKLPVVSYEIFSKGKSTWHWNYLYDAKGSDGAVNRNTQNSAEHQFEAKPDVWTTLSFDYRQPGDLNNDAGDPIDASRINALLINVHDSKPSWPFTNASGVFYIRNIKFGDKAVYTPEKIYTTFDAVPGQSVFENAGPCTVKITGITNGKGSVSGVTLTVTSTSAKIAEVTNVSEINSDGTAEVTYVPHLTGAINLIIKVSAPDVETKAASCNIRILKNDPAAFSRIFTDRTKKYQTMRGFGTFLPDARFEKLYATELGASAVRLGIIGNQWEPVNDNDDPEVLNLEGFDYEAFDWDYLRQLKADGVESFIITSWSPPAWMKRNLSLDHKEQAIEWEKTDNILEPYYYEEFAESMAALVKAMKQEAGIDILAVGLQNEPYFNEPYSSAILSGSQFVELIKTVSARFKKEGLDNVGFYMPEQVFGIGWGDYSCEGYLATLQKDEVANGLCKYFAVHGYDATGITPGFPDYDRWTSMSAKAAEGSNPKETWMTETYISYSTWSSALDLAGAIHGSLWAGNISLWTNWSFDGMQVSKNQPNSSFWTSMNYFKFIRPGDVRIDSYSDNPDLLVTAFETPAGNINYVIINKGTSPVPANITGNNLPSQYHIYRTSASENCRDAGILLGNENAMIFTPGSVTTLVSEENSLLTMNQVEDVTVYRNSGEFIISIDGISDGNGSSDGLSLTLENSNQALFGNMNISAIGADGKASVNFTPASDLTGFAKIKLTLSGTEGAERIVSFMIYVLPDVRVNDLNETLFRIWPNPATEIVNLEFLPGRFSSLTVADISGREICKQEIISDRLALNVKNWNPGIYIIRMNGDKDIKTSRISIK
jgi:O-glycosyl hydrolase